MYINKKINYAPLVQSTPSDDEDKVEFSKGTFTNTHSSRSRKAEEAIPMMDLGTGAAKLQRSSVADAYANRIRRKSKKKYAIMILASCVVATLMIAGAIRGYFYHSFNGVVLDTLFSPYGDWLRFFNNSLTESSVLLLDVDGDKLEDVLVGFISLDSYKAHQKFVSASDLTFRDACSKQGLPYPCLGRVEALRGFDQKLLWGTWLRSELLFMNCDNVDVNNDAKRDCIFTGRDSSVQAVDIATGQTHWSVDPDNSTWSSYFTNESSSWNVYKALSIPDVDGDDIQDFIVTHGGYKSYVLAENSRKPGRIILLSGASGRPIGRYLEMPDGKETHMSPVKHITSNGSIFILFGSGGETVPGDLMIASYSDLLSYIMGNETSPLRTLFRICKSLGYGRRKGPIERYKVSIQSIHTKYRYKLVEVILSCHWLRQLSEVLVPFPYKDSGSKKGIMVAPVLADVTMDGTPDILMSAFEGVVILFDGESLTQLWTQLFEEMESYSTPCPGHYNGDDALDFLMLWGYGERDSYDFAMEFIVSGKDGIILLQKKSSTIQMFSQLSLRTEGPLDLFLTFTVGFIGGDTSSTILHQNSIRKVRHGEDNEAEMLQPVEKQDFLAQCEFLQEQYSTTHVVCEEDTQQANLDMLLFDEKSAYKPVTAYSLAPELYHYNLPVEENGRHCHTLSPGIGQIINMCVVKIPSAVTAAVGDVDGDGEPELILITRLTAKKITDTYTYFNETGDVIVARVSLNQYLEKLGLVGHLKPMHEQPWRQFMGSHGDNVYRPDFKYDCWSMYC